MKSIHLSASWSLAKRKLVAFMTLIFTCGLASTGYGQTFVFTNIWNISTADGRSYVTAAAGNERGITVNPLTTNVILVSRATTPPLVAVLNGETGAEIRLLDASTITSSSPGFFKLNKVQVADDGVVYAANMTLNGTTADYVIYRWESEDDLNPPIIAYSGDPGNGTAFRWGDSFALRGAGTNTQIIASGSAATKIAFFTTTDGTNFSLTTLTPSVVSGVYGKGLAFGTNNTFYSKHSPETILRHFSFDLNAATATLLTTAGGVDNDMVGIFVDTTNNLLAGTLSANTTTAPSHRLRIYDISTFSSPVLLKSVDFPGPFVADGNRAGEADLAGNKIVGVGAQNGVVALQFDIDTTPVAPILISQPQSQTVLQGGYVTFNVSATGTQPLSYQWRLNETNNIVNATNNSLTLTNLQFTNAGNYSVVVTNVAGTTNSENAELVITPAVLSAAMVQAWCLAPGQRPYLGNDNGQRGMAYNPTTDHLLLVSRTPSVAVRVLDAATGADLHTLDLTGISGGFAGFPLNMIGVADDGVVYACNLFNGGTAAEVLLKIYRWDDEGAVNTPTVAYGPADPGIGRLGDTFDVRGSGTGTQILMGSHLSGNQAVIFTTTDGVTFTPTVVTTDAEPGFARLGVAFGKGDTFWAKSVNSTPPTALPLRHVSFDLGTMSGVVLQTFTVGESNITVIGVDVENDLLAGISCVDPGATPDNLQLYDIINLSSEPVLLDQDFFPTDNLNGNGTGAVDFGGGRVYALDSNNGICAFNVIARLKHFRDGNNLVLSWTGPSMLQCSTNVTGPYTTVGGATSPYTNSTASPPPQKFFILKR